MCFSLNTVRCAKSVLSGIGHKLTLHIKLLANGALVLALHYVQSMIYTSSKGRRATYITLAYSDKQLSLHVLAVIVVARAKLKQSQLFGLGGIYRIE